MSSTLHGATFQKNKILSSRSFKNTFKEKHHHIITEISQISNSSSSCFQPTGRGQESGRNANKSANRLSSRQEFWYSMMILEYWLPWHISPIKLKVHLRYGLNISSTKQRPSWEVNNYTAGPAISCIQRKLEVQYCAHNCLALVPILSQMNPIHALRSSIRPHIILSSHLHLGLTNGVDPSGLT